MLSKESLTFFFRPLVISVHFFPQGLCSFLSLALEEESPILWLARFVGTLFLCRGARFVFHFCCCHSENPSVHAEWGRQGEEWGLWWEVEQEMAWWIMAAPKRARF